jgi:hypothetical protein
MGIRTVSHCPDLVLAPDSLYHASNITEGLAADSGLADQYMPYYDISDANVRCGRGAATSGPGTKTATVLAGSTVGFAIGRSADEVNYPPFLSPSQIQPAITYPSDRVDD